MYVLKKQAVDEEFPERMSVEPDSGVALLGRYGYAARSTVFALIGYFLIQAGVTYQPSDAGLSATRQELATKSWGQWLLWPSPSVCSPTGCSP